jgi:ABC-type iron transport system FetAB permease component
MGVLLNNLITTFIPQSRIISQGLPLGSLVFAVKKGAFLGMSARRIRRALIPKNAGTFIKGISKEPAIMKGKTHVKS